jgi:hypothetical protein
LERLDHIGGDAHELAQYERRPFRLSLGDNKLHGCGIHAIAQGRYHTKISSREQGIKLILLDHLMATNRKISATRQL